MHTLSDGHVLLDVHLGLSMAPTTASQYRKGMFGCSLSSRCSSRLRVATAPMMLNTPEIPHILAGSSALPDALLSVERWLQGPSEVTASRSCQVTFK